MKPKLASEIRLFSFINLPEKNKQKNYENLINFDLDYLQYSCREIFVPIKFLNSLWFSWTIDSDNSNVEYNPDYSLSLFRYDTKLWHAYIITFLSPWFAPLPIISIEVYEAKQKRTLKTDGRVVLYWAFFRFKQIILEQCPAIITFANSLELGTMAMTSHDWRSLYKRTRVDIAFDIAWPLDQNFLKKYIKPHKNSKSVPRPYNHCDELWGWQSIGYVNLTTSWIRVYNKILDIEKKNKQPWYPDYWTWRKYETVTRIELVWGTRYAQHNIDTIKKISCYRILWLDSLPNYKPIQRPKSVYSPENAYEYFKRYAKNHWQSIESLIHDISLQYLQSMDNNELIQS